MPGLEDILGQATGQNLTVGTNQAGKTAHQAHELADQAPAGGFDISFLRDIREGLDELENIMEHNALKRMGVQLPNLGGGQGQQQAPPHQQGLGAPRTGQPSPQPANREAGISRPDQVLPDEDTDDEPTDDPLPQDTDTMDPRKQAIYAYLEQVEPEALKDQVTAQIAPVTRLPDDQLAEWSRRIMLAVTDIPAEQMVQVVYGMLEVVDLDELEAAAQQIQDNLTPDGDDS